MEGARCLGHFEGSGRAGEAGEKKTILGRMIGDHYGRDMNVKSRMVVKKIRTMMYIVILCTNQGIGKRAQREKTYLYPPTDAKATNEISNEDAQ